MASRACPGWAFRSRIQREPWGAASPPGAILVGFVAVSVSDRRGSGTYHNSYHNPGFGLRRSPVTADFKDTERCPSG
jgi:hypothetical protein